MVPAVPSEREVVVPSRGDPQGAGRGDRPRRRPRELGEGRPRDRAPPGAYARYQATDRFALELEADALAAPQGRAEDVSLKGVFRVSDRVDVDLGYRLLEGGADNDSVYTFAFFHYAVAGVRVRF